ncbi:uncharacterized protein LOC117607439 [Osmia lignaria lignaria]|uniref:uncharacterized protein LOC117607439 n=1 Tax=Osmia lignaria lignaria TaxID=1437193 RepID=UPI00402BC276
MFTESVLILLLYTTRTLVHCAYNGTESSEEFLQKCCIHDIDVIDDRENRCDLETLNDTLTVVSYHSLGNAFDTLCCSVCSESLFELEVEPKRTVNEQEYINLDEKANPRRRCFKTCISDGQTIRIWKDRKKNGSEDEQANCTFAGNSNKSEENEDALHCESVFSSLNFWGANMVVFANIIYIFPYAIVVSIYLAVLRKSTRAYHKAVLWYNVSQLILNAILIGIGACILCHVSIHSNVYSILGLLIMFLTISSTFWLLVICIDMTLVITRFRWASSNSADQEEEKEKFVTYAGWAWGGSLLPTVIVGIVELTPLLPISSPARPNFSQFEGANLAVILYVTTLPVIACLSNTVLFCYTSYKMILIQKSTKLATESSSFKTNTVKTRYFLFLKLYLLMDAPWITSALAAAFTDLWVLKFLRMIQPILMLCAILPPGTISHAFSYVCSFPKSKRIGKTDRTP